MGFSPFKNWWILGLKGLFVIVFGILALFYPEDTVVVLTLYFGILNLIAGIALIVFSFKNRSKQHWVWFLAEGIIDILFGLVVLLNPSMTALLLTLLIGAWMLGGGIFQIWFAIQNRNQIFNYRMALINGIVTSALGGCIAFFPVSGIIAISWLIGFATLFFGSLLVTTAFQLLKFKKAFDE